MAGAPGSSKREVTWLTQAGLVLGKDLRIELRTGEVLTTAGFFAVLVVIMSSIAFFSGPATRSLVAGGVIWLSASFAAVLSLGRTWQREREENALEGLLIAPVSRSAIFAGKAAGILLFLLCIEAIIIPVSALLFALDLLEVGGGIVLIALIATPGVAAAGTLFGAMTVRTQARDLILAIVLFPLLSPTLLSAIAATRTLLDGAPLSELSDYLKFMAVFDVAFISGGLALFGSLIES